MKRLILAVIGCIVMTGCSSLARYVVRAGGLSNEPEIYQSVVKIALNMEIMTPDGLQKGQASGTAWAIDDDHLITAGHVCTAFLEARDQGVARGLEIGFEDGSGEVRVKPANEIDVLFVEEQEDLCMLSYPHHGLKPLKLAKTVTFREPVYVIGAPLGILGFITPGQVVDAHIDLGDQDFDRTIVSSASTHGNSGGPVVNDDGEVIGVLIGGVESFDHLSICTGLHDLKAFVGLLK